MHHYGGTQKITFGSPGGPDSEYAAKLAAAQAQAAYIDMGVQAVQDEGTGRTFMQSHQDPVFGNINHTVGDMQQGLGSNFSLTLDPFNAPLQNPERSTGSMINGTSSTVDPQTNPSELDSTALVSRINQMARQGRINLNPSSVYGLS